MFQSGPARRCSPLTQLAAPVGLDAVLCLCFGCSCFGRAILLVYTGSVKGRRRERRRRRRRRRIVDRSLQVHEQRGGFGENCWLRLQTKRQTAEGNGARPKREGDAVRTRPLMRQTSDSPHRSRIWNRLLSQQRTEMIKKEVLRTTSAQTDEDSGQDSAITTRDKQERSERKAAIRN